MRTAASNAMATATGRRRSKKRKTTAACGGVTLPDHVVAEVLLRLPARSLARLRCACRSWNAEISSRGFQVRHHALAAAKFAFLQPTPPHVAPIRMGKGSSRPSLPLLANCYDCPRVIGSNPCCGLVLVSRPCTPYASVCNLTTGEMLHLPPSRQTHCASGIGFHAPAREFKVVRLSIQPGKLHAIVLTVGDARGWRSPSAGSNASLVGLTDDADALIDRLVKPVFADGYLHWSFRPWCLDKPHGILSFSLADESFRLLPQPPFSTVDLVPYDINDGDQKHGRQLEWTHGRRSESRESVAMPVGKTLAELDGRLCMVRDVRHRSDVGGLLFEIWKLQDYDTGRWSLDYRIDLSTPAGQVMADRLTEPWLVLPLRYLDDDDDGGGLSSGEKKRKLLLTTTAQEAHVYDPDFGTLRTVASIADRGGANSGKDDDSIRLVLYQESLVRFPAMKQAKGKIDFVQLRGQLR